MRTRIEPNTDINTALERYAQQSGRAGEGKWTLRRIVLKAFWLLLYPIGYVVSSVFSRQPSFVEEFFSTGIYPAVSHAVGGAFSVFPFSFAEFLLCSLVGALAVFVIVCVVKAVRHTLPFGRFVSWVLTILIIGGVGYNAFYWMWGFNYYRVPLSARMGLDTSENTQEELHTLCFALASAANALRPIVPEDADGVFMYTGGNRAVLERIPSAYERLGQAIPMFSDEVYNPKPVLWSEGLSYAGIAGIFIPFTEEANVNVDDPPLCVASSAAHETAHFLGVASEDGASFVAYLACVSSNDPQIRYSGIMQALILAGNALNTVDPQAYAALHAMYDDGLRRDLDDYNAYLAAHEGEVAEKAEEMNDSYLRSHQQTSGVRSYGEMVDLLLAFYREVGLFTRDAGGAGAPEG